MISNPAFFRRDITEGKPGLPLTLRLTLVNVANGCSPISGYNIEVWQCDASGNYSEYSQPGFNGAGQTFLRGLQTTEANGQVTFNTVYPGWYQGRATHIHVDVFRGTTTEKRESRKGAKTQRKEAGGPIAMSDIKRLTHQGQKMKRS